MHIELQQIHKRFGKVEALKGIDLKVSGGTIHGLVGENGAGKSTLMKILTGYLSSSGGRILLDGEAVKYGTPAEAAGLGIGMLYQEPQDFPPLSVLENFMVGRDSHPDGNRARQRKRLQGLAEKARFELDPDTPVEKLTIGERQQLELLRLLGRNARVLILDEPTTGISERQKERLFQALYQMRDQGRTILLISHKLDEVSSLCDRVTILRQGRVVGEEEAPFHISRLLELMFDQSHQEPVPRPDSRPGRAILDFDRVVARGERNGLHQCSVTLRQGEVVGLAGLSGSGQGLFLRLAAALQRPLEGEVHSLGHSHRGRKHSAFRRAGGTFLPADRLEEGLIPGFTIQDHFALARGLPAHKARETAVEAIDRFNIHGQPESPVDALSGGNQQRLQLSLIPEDARLILLEEPTRGLDVSSGEWIWHHLLERYGTTGAIVFSSAELEEILAVATRVLVFFDGRVVRDLGSDQLDYQHIASAMTGN